MDDQNLTTEGVLEQQKLYNKIIDIIQEPYKNKEQKPSIKIRDSYEIVHGKFLLINMPKQYKEQYHGSSYEIECDKTCRTNGTLISKLNDENQTKNKLKELTCNIWGIHKYGIFGPGPKGVHFHFRCDSKSYDNTIKITKFIKDF